MRVHLIEVGGEGGIYQHTLAVAKLLRSEGLEVTLHTADRTEVAPPGDIEVCGCVKWFRNMPRGRTRRLLIGASYMLWTVPHLVRRVGCDDIAHYQGHILRPITAALLWLLRLRAGRLIHSPHNTFMRVFTPLGVSSLRLCALAARKSIVFSEHDAARIRGWGGEAVTSPLIQYLPPVEDAGVAAWRDRWQANGSPVVLFAGQLREDKCLDVLIEAVARLGRDAKLAVVGGQDAGQAEPYRALADERGVDASWNVGFCPLEDFAAAITAADLVVCPYRQASQSGVLAVAHQLGAATVATDVGGLAELADIAVRPGDPDALAAAIEAVLAEPRRRSAAEVEEAARAAHLAAYGLAQNANGAL